MEVIENRQDLVDLLQSKLDDLFNDDKVEFCYLVGSWAEDTASWWSDIDIFVSIPYITSITDKDQSKIVVDMSLQAFRLTGIEKLNLSIIELLPLHVQYTAIKNGILLYETDTETRHDFIEQLYIRYFDHKIWYESYLDQSLEVD